jgi:hypothetical protein
MEILDSRAETQRKEMKPHFETDRATREEKLKENEKYDRTRASKQRFLRQDRHTRVHL